MTSLDTLQMADLKQVINSKSLKRARGYIGRIRNEVRSGRSLRAKVGDSRIYDVEIEVAEDGVHAVCSCPYNWGGYCKHIGAVLLKWLESADSFVIEMPAPRPTDGIIETIPIEPPATFVPKELPWWVVGSYAERCKQNDESLQESLREYKVQELRQIAKKQGWSIKGTRKDDIIQQIMEKLLKPGILLKTLLSMDSEQLQVYQAMSALYSGIAYQESYLKELAEQWGKLTKYKSIAAYTDNLCNLGLAVLPQYSYSYLHRMAFIPASIFRYLPPQLAERVPEASLPTHAKSETQIASPKSFLQKFHQVLILLEQTQPPLRKPMPRPRLEKYHDFLQEWDYLPEEIHQAQLENKLRDYNEVLDLTIPPPQLPLPDETIKNLTPISGNAEQLNFIYQMLLAVGLLQPGSPITVWREVREQFFRQNEAVQWAIILRAYFELLSWNEVWLMLAEQPNLQLKRAKANYYALTKPKNFYGMLAVFRIQVLQLLACLPDERWYNLEETTKLLRVIVPRFDSWCWSHGRYPGDNRPGWFLTENGRFLDTSTSQTDWDKTHGEFIRHVIQGPLHWLGVADIALEDGRLVAFRLHGLHDLYFDKVASLPLADVPVEKMGSAITKPVTGEPIFIENNNIVVDPTAVSAQAHNYFDSIARLNTVDPTKFVYCLDAAAVHQSFETGQTLAQIMDGWYKWLEVPMPETIQSQLTAWWEAYGRVRMYENVTVIEFSDEYALAEMKAATSLEKYLVAEISSNLVIIQESAVNNLVNELEKAGYTPKQADKV